MNYRKIFLGVALLNTLYFISCQTKEQIQIEDIPIFIKLIGTPNQEIAYEIIQSSDGGYTCIGATGDFDKEEQDSIYLVKTDVYGNREWIQIYTGGEGRSIIVTADGGYAILGDSVRDDGNSNLYLIKVDATGNLQWGRTYGDTTEVDKGYRITITDDGNYILIGTNQNRRGGQQGIDMYIIKTDTQGNIIFDRKYGLTGLNNTVGGVLENNTGNFIWCGTASRFIGSSLDMRVVLADEEGDLIWDYFFGGDGSEFGFDIQQLSDGGYIIAGSTDSQGAGLADAWLVRLNADGIEQWNKTFGGDQNDYAYAVSSTSDGGFILTGRTESFSGNSDVFVVKTDSQGNEEWFKTYGGTKFDIGSDILVDPEGYVILGTFEFENNTMMGIIKTNATGEIIR